MAYLNSNEYIKLPILLFTSNHNALLITAQSVPGRAVLIDVDTDKNGSYDTRLKWNYLHNIDIKNVLIFQMSLNLISSKYSR